MSDVDWSTLDHAYGSAVDTPDHLRALESGDERAVQAALTHLFTSVSHQNSHYSATPPAVVHLAGLLQRDALPGPVTGEIVEHLDEIADDVRRAELAGRKFRLLGTLGAALRDAVPALVHLLDAEAASTRTAAATAAVSVCLTRAGATVRPVVLTAFRSRLEVAGPDDRGVIVREMSRLGADVSEWLDDPSPHIGVCAAMASGAAHDERATAILVDALGSSDAAGGYGTELYDLATIVEVVVDRGLDLDAISKEAERAAGVTAAWAWSDVWGPLMGVAFPSALTSWQQITDAQRGFLGALVANDCVWMNSWGRAGDAFGAAGLPLDRGVCRVLASGVDLGDDVLAFLLGIGNAGFCGAEGQQPPVNRLGGVSRSNDVVELLGSIWPATGVAAEPDVAASDVRVVLWVGAAAPLATVEITWPDLVASPGVFVGAYRVADPATLRSWFDRHDPEGRFSTAPR